MRPRQGAPPRGSSGAASPKTPATPAGALQGQPAAAAGTATGAVAAGGSREASKASTALLGILIGVLTVFTVTYLGRSAHREVGRSGSHATKAGGSYFGNFLPVAQEEDPEIPPGMASPPGEEDGARK